jgi:DNA polymerase
LEAGEIKKQLMAWVKLEEELGIDLLPVPRRNPTIESLRGKALRCKACALHKTRKNVVFGEGNLRASLMFVGEAPGAEEDQQGRPFVGASGMLLDKMISAMGLKRNQCYISNVVKCRPPNNRDPNPFEISSCFGYIKKEIEILNPQVICTLGRVATKTLLGLKEKDAFSSVRGKWHTFQGIPLMPTYHPSYLLRNPDKKREAWEDLKQIMKRLGNENV